MAKNTPNKKGNRPKTRPASQQRVVKAQSVAKESAAKSSVASRKTQATEVVLPFGRQNYLLLLLGVGIIALGFFLMSLDDFVDAEQFSISLYIAPVVVVAGFFEIIYAIMYRPQTITPSPSTD